MDDNHIKLQKFGFKAPEADRPMGNKHKDKYKDNCNVKECDMITDYANMPSRMVLAHAYVPWQRYNPDRLFSPAEALEKGTLFADLWGVYKPPKCDD